MKLCTICDKKIEGTWCKTCHRFVKTYDLPSRIYLNERHDPANDTDCTYHNDSNVTKAREKATSGTGRAYSASASAASSSSTASAGTTRSTAKKKGKKTALIILVIYILVNSLGFIFSAIEGLFDDISEGFREEVSENEFYEDEADFSEEELEELFNREIRNEELMQLTPHYRAEEEDFEILYFDPEDIEGIAYPCDNRHFEMTLEEFESWLLANSEDSFQYTEDTSMYSNYFYISSDYSQASFNCYRDYYSSSDFRIRADYDTATKQLHLVRFTTEGDSLDMNLCLSLVKVLEPDTEWTEAEFVQDVKEAKAVGDYATMYYSEQAHVAFEPEKEGYTLVYYPVD